MSNHNLFFNRNKKNNVYPCKRQFYYITDWLIRFLTLPGNWAPFYYIKVGHNYIGMFSWYNYKNMM